MGCDIHFVLERRKKSGGKWLGVYTTDVLLIEGRPKPKSRDYDFFAEVAGVRGKPSDRGHRPKNLPEDISDLAWQEYMRAPLDYHSPSHLSADDFCAAYARVNPSATAGEHTTTRLLGWLDVDDFDFRVVFWFDN